ncbi:hypothetical protein DFH08DRAFT_804000 [Mycena albidolilacea]|uniref:Uncharacterized protein n=1 Tax=Mycena albidolilacea TaxID=1033008 RepID=A0AAD7AB49_9AGAR|nr:hypothetical protein DFH08DRAFT_804000 [Mycena albidolilacea]
MTTPGFKCHRQGATRSIAIDGKIISVPVLTVNDFCQQYHLSQEICKLLNDAKFESAGALLEVAEGNLEKAGFKQGQIAELKRALREFLSITMVVTMGRKMLEFRASKASLAGNPFQTRGLNTTTIINQWWTHVQPEGQEQEQQQIAPQASKPPLLGLQLIHGQERFLVVRKAFFIRPRPPMRDPRRAHLNAWHDLFRSIETLNVFLKINIADFL